MSTKTATLIGATGLIGKRLLQLLLEDPYFDTVRILIRRPYELKHPKLEKKIVDFSDDDSMIVAIENSDVVFCTIGTTQRKVKGDKATYRKIDYDIAVNAARFSKMTGCEKFILVSSVGANSKSNNFYLRLKGEVEDAVKAHELRSVYFMRPSLLLGERKESRPGETISQKLMPLFAILIPSKYKPIQAGDVAKAMLAAAKKNDKGFFIWEYNAIKQSIKSM